MAAMKVIIVLVILSLCSIVLSWTSTAFTVAHNNVRASPGATPATPLSNLTWDSSLQNTAQNYANLCPTTCEGHNANRSVGYPTYVGENIYWTLGESSTIENDSVVAWDSERQYYNYQTGACSNVCGHFTQLVWANTALVGCGVAVCPYPSSCSSFMPGYSQWFSTFTVVVCDYRTGGNIVGQLPYVLASGVTPTPSTTPTASPSITRSSSKSLSPSSSKSVSPSSSNPASTTPSSSAAASTSAAASSTPSASKPASTTPTASPSKPASSTPSVTSSKSLSASSVPSNTVPASPSSTPAASNSPSASKPASSTPSASPSKPASSTPSASSSKAASSTPSASSSISISGSSSVTKSITPSSSPSSSSTCGTCSQFATCSNGVCTCLTGYQGDGITCNPISQTVPSFIDDWSRVRGNNVATISGTTLEFATYVSTPVWYNWINASPVLVGSNQFTVGASIKCSSGDIALGIRFDQSSVSSYRSKDAALWIGRIDPSTSTISFYFCFVYYAPGSYSCDFSSSYGTQPWNLNTFNNFSISTTISNGVMYTSPKLNGANAIIYSSLYFSSSYYPSSGSVAVIANNTNYVGWQNIFIQTETSIFMSFTSCMTTDEVINLIAQTLNISPSSITATSSTVDSSSCSKKRSTEAVAATAFTVTFSGNDGMVAQAMASKLTTLVNQGSVPGATSATAAAPANLAEVYGSGIAVAGPTQPTGAGAAAGGGGGGGGGLDSAAIVGIVVGSVGGALLLAGVVAVIVVAAILIVSKQRNSENMEEAPPPRKQTTNNQEIDLAYLEEAANQEENEGITHAVRKTIYNLFRAPKGGVDVTGPKGHQSITARAVPIK